MASKSAAPVTARSSRDRQPSSKQAELEEITTKASSTKVQAAARKVDAATAGSITSQNAPPTLVKKTIVPRAANSRTTVQASVRAPVQDRSRSAGSQIIRQTFNRDSYSRRSDQDCTRLHSPLPPPDNAGVETLFDEVQDGTNDDEDQEDLEEYSSGPQSVPNSEPASEDNDSNDDNQPVLRSNREYASPPPASEAPNGQIHRRRIVRYEERHRSESNIEPQGHKRVLSETTSALNDQPQKIQKTVPHDGRACRGDFDNDVQDVIKTAQGLMKVKLYAINAFPTASQQEEWIPEIWTEANRFEGVDYQINSDVHKLLLRCTTQLHSAVKDAARKVVTSEYRFSDSISKKDKELNKAKYEKLMGEGDDDDSLPCWLFPRSDMKKPAAERKNIYRNPAISSFTNKTVYNNRSRSSIGIKYPDRIGTCLTPAHIAFNLTMIQFALTEWEDGYFNDTIFTEDAGRKAYIIHQADLLKFEQAFGEEKLIRLGTKLVENGRNFAGLGPYMTASENTGRIALSAFERMAALSAEGGESDGRESDGNESGEE
ncbi:hypothetical protein BC835DRAFT_1522300 [Cytidiella melzeri]|nr:hypothetical protein BC835DRAFT_1522300 [Cytidiella melzeri]